ASVPEKTLGRVTVVKHVTRKFKDGSWGLGIVLSASSEFVQVIPDRRHVDGNIYMCQGFVDGSDNGGYALALGEFLVEHFGAPYVVRAQVPRGPHAVNREPFGTFSMEIPDDQGHELFWNLLDCTRTDHMIDNPSNISEITRLAVHAFGDDDISMTVATFPNGAFTLMAMCEEFDLAMHGWPELKQLDLNVSTRRAGPAGAFRNGTLGLAQGLADFFGAGDLEKACLPRGPVGM
ncbi:MAG: S-adenosylmethionine decarboxylase, partial [Candidatus Parcubacteria bacterium]